MNKIIKKKKFRHFYFGFQNSQSLVSIRLSKEQHVEKCLTTMNYSELCKIDRFVQKSKKKKTVKKNKKKKKSNKKGKKVIKRKRQSRASDAGFKRALTYIFNKYGKKKAKSQKKKKK